MGTERKKNSSTENWRNCAKYTSAILDILVTVFGGAILIHAVLVCYEDKYMDYVDHLMNQKTREQLKMDQVFLCMYGVMAIASLCLVAGLVGITAVGCQSYCTLVVLLVLLVVIITSQIGLAIGIGMKTSDMKTWVQGSLAEVIGNYANVTKEKRTYIDHLQRTFSCCGGGKGRGDYANMTVPNSCSGSTKPCPDAVWKDGVLRNLFIALGLGCSALAIEFVAGVFSVIMLSIVQHEVVRRGNVTIVLNKSLDNLSRKSRGALVRRQHRTPSVSERDTRSETSEASRKDKRRRSVASERSDDKRQGSDDKRRRSGH